MIRETAAGTVLRPWDRRQPFACLFHGVIHRKKNGNPSSVDKVVDNVDNFPAQGVDKGAKGLV